VRARDREGGASGYLRQRPRPVEEETPACSLVSGHCSASGGERAEVRYLASSRGLLGWESSSSLFRSVSIRPGLLKWAAITRPA
jgi:hypothetical protein